VGYTPEDEVCITTVVVKGPGASLRAAEQHERVSQLFLAEFPGGGAPPARASGARPVRYRALPHRAPGARRLPALGFPRRGPGGDSRLRYLFLAASFLFMALALLFGYQAFK
jgi:hypothetical protein